MGRPPLAFGFVAQPPKLIDVRQRGRERVISAWDLGGAIVDPGPERRVETLLEGLVEEPRALLLTHIHLDHAGAAGALVERFPQLEVWVHARGAPHLADPSRLLASAERIYGDEMQELWGRVLPVPERNLRVVEGGERIAVAGRELDVAYTPGHASHHVVYLDRSDGTAYMGDVAGVRIPPSDFVRPPTPPPDIDVEQWLASIDLVAAQEPARLALTHFGMVEDPQPHLEQTAERLHQQAALVRSLLDEHGDTEQAVAEFVREVDRRTREAAGVDTAAVFEVGAPVEQLWQGLRRYWHKRAESPSTR
jgi:glyoxylase-like metal-dependent hydrolase (beta-lactamase superfamily II)